MKRQNRTAVYVIAVCVILLVANITLGFVLTRQSGAALRTLINNRMLDISNTAAAMLDGDMLEILQKDDEDAPAYQSVLKTLTYYQENIDLEYIYCIRDMGNGRFVFTIDPAEDPGEFGEPVVSTEALYQASLGTPAVDKEPYEDAWGRFYSAYSPVFNSQHKVSGIVAVDFSADWYDQQISSHVKTTLFISSIAFILAAVVIALIIARYRRRFRTMIGEMNVISDGIETLVREVSPGAERIEMSRPHKAQSRDQVAELGSRIQALENRLGERISFVRSQAYLDGLTQLGNRTAYEDHVRRLNAQIQEGTAEFSVVLFDLNGLKEINDFQGHEQGDQAIAKVADALKRVFETEGKYRIGGDEFVVIADSASDEIDKRLLLIDEIMSEDGALSVAGGFAVFDGKTDARYRDVFQRADNAMYKNKKQHYQGNKDRRANQTDVS